MNSEIFQESELVGFSSQGPIAYGNLISIIDEVKEQDGEWTMLALLPSGGQEEIYFDTAEVNGKSFIVLRSRQVEGERFLHHAVSVERLEEAITKIEGRIIKLLGTTL